LDVEAKRTQYALFGGEEGGATALVGALGDVVCFCFLLLELGGVNESGREAGEVGVDVDDTPW
jgi:hypothetical protein